MCKGEDQVTSVVLVCSSCYCRMQLILQAFSELLLNVLALWNASVCAIAVNLCSALFLIPSL
jgi:hypothetical protein